MNHYYDLTVPAVNCSIAEKINVVMETKSAAAYYLCPMNLECVITVGTYKVTPTC